MKTTVRNYVMVLGVLMFGAWTLARGQSGIQFTRSAIMNGNQVRTVFGNWGIIGQPGTQGKRGAWKNDNNGYLGDVSPLVGAEVRYNGYVFHSVETCPFYPTQRPAAVQDVDPKTGQFWTFEPVGGYLNANQDKVATKRNPASWPPFWPDKLNDVTDPGWRGSWNGYFGKRGNATEETYFVMDDNGDARFNDVVNNTIGGGGIAFKPDANNLSRNGLGLEVRVRALQWNAFLAKDNIFWLYEITNTGTTNYDKTVFGMLVGTYVGVTSVEDYREYQDDFSFYDVNNNITYTGDFKAINGQRMNNPLWVGGTGLVGYAFLESPGNPYDGIDNDGDADSSLIGRTLPLFTSSDFDSTLLTAGKRIVSIRDDYSRSVITVPASDSLRFWTRGLEDSIWIYPGRTRVAEGNYLSIRTATDTIEGVNPNALDGIDNNFNGLIDENYSIHYRQLKRDRKIPPTILIDILRPVRHVDYASGGVANPVAMVDERRDDQIDNNGDWNVTYDDVGRDGVAETNDFGEGDGSPTSGYTANGTDTGLPGEPHIDKTDVRESDQIGLTSFFYFEPSGQVRLGDKEYLWKNLSPGYFDVPPTIINNRPIAGSDGDFFYGSGYFPLRAKKTERFSLALVYGGGLGGGLDADLADLLKNKKTVQKIYDANYQFPDAPERPTLTAVADSHQVTLYWDRKSELWVDPVLRTRTFEGYKLYKSTDPNFSDIYTITDGSGSPTGYRPLAQYDLINGIKGYFLPPADLYQSIAGYSFYLGSDNGVKHTYVDKAVDNGRRYYYALVSYSRGDGSVGILPQENSLSISIEADGTIIHDANVVVAVPNAKTSGYVAPQGGVSLTHTQRYGTGDAYYTIVDPKAITGHPYRVEFLDSQVEAVDNNGIPTKYSTDSTKWDRKTTSYTVRDLTIFTETFVSLDTALVQLSRKNLVPGTAVVKNGAGSVVGSTAYRIDYPLGSIKGSAAGTLPLGTYTVAYEYYPVFRSPNIQGSPYLTDSFDADNFDGIQLVFQNDWGVAMVDSLSHWVGKNAYVYSMSPLFTQDPGPPVRDFRGYRRPADYRIEFANTIVDTSYYDEILYPISTPVNFRVYNETDSVYVKFIFSDLDGNNRISPKDGLVFMDTNPRGQISYSWNVNFTAKQGDPPDTLYNLGAGDQLLLRTTKSFRLGDKLDFTTKVPVSDPQLAANSLSRIRVVPNPYVTQSQFELPLSPGVTSGRGQRKVDFIHLPPLAKIQIFTSRGDHVATLYHDGNIEDGTVSWNLKSKENLDIAYGVYFYTVESPAGNTTGKIAIIK